MNRFTEIVLKLCWCQGERNLKSFFLEISLPPPLYYYKYTKQVKLTLKNCFRNTSHCVKNVRIWSYSGPHFPAFGLNTERYSVSLRIQSECGKIRTRITPNTDTFYALSRILILRNKRTRFIS